MSFDCLIDNDVVSDHEAPQAWIDTLQKWPAEMWVISKGLDSVKQILNDTLGRCWIVFGDEVQEFRDSVQSRIRPDDPVTH